jgi:hypothetical protein
VNPERVPTGHNGDSACYKLVSTLFQLEKSEKKLDTSFGTCYSSADFVTDKDRSSAWGRFRITVIFTAIEPMAVSASVGRIGFERR